MRAPQWVPQLFGVAWIALGATDADEKSFSVMFGDASISMNTQGGRIDHGSLLTTIFSEKFSRDGALGWLRDGQNMCTRWKIQRSPPP